MTSSYKMVLLGLCISTIGFLEGVSCNERARHGSIGAFKGASCVVGALGFHYMIKEVWRTAQPIMNGTDSVEVFPRDRALYRTVCATIALTVVGYYTFFTGAVTSLNIFFYDEQDGVAPQHTRVARTQ